MDNTTKKYINWQTGLYFNGKLTVESGFLSELTLSELTPLSILQVAFDEKPPLNITLPPPRTTYYDEKNDHHVLRIEPLKILIIHKQAMNIEQEGVYCLDVSASHVGIKLSGKQAAGVLNRHLPIDLRDNAFKVGAMASTAFHHSRVIIFRNDDINSQQCFTILLPRGFAKSLAELLIMSANQFCYEINN